MSTSSTQPEPPGGVVEQRGMGMLRVQVPHWAFQVTIYDGLYQRVMTAGGVHESSPGSGAYEVVSEVPPGIYEVEARLAEQSQRQLVAVYPAQTVTVEQSTWTLKLPSAAPLTSSANTHEWHEAPAQEWSRSPTWTRWAGAGSRLFMFV